MPENLTGNQNKNGSSEEKIPPTNEPENLNTDSDTELKDYVATLEARIAGQQVEYRKVQQRLENIENKKPPAPPKDIEAEDRRYYTSPTSVMDERDKNLEDRIMDRIERSLKPIRDVASRITANSEYEDLKYQVSRDPVFAKAMQDKDVMTVVDRMMATPGVSMDEGTLKMAISSTSFSKQNGLLKGVRRAENNNDGDGDRRGNGDDTAYLPPSNRRREAPREEKILTEDDKLAMRIGGITDPKEYWELIEADKLILAPDKQRERGKK